jgi:hypothetical protein
MNTLETIHSPNLISVAYWENYKGQNPNSAGKNILNIGEAHLPVTKDEFLPFLHFIDCLIQKNISNKNCLDIIVEDSVQKIPSKRVKYSEKQHFEEYNEFDENNEISMLVFRNYLSKRKNIKGLRIHYVDQRITCSGFYVSFVTIYTQSGANIRDKNSSFYNSIYDKKSFMSILCFLYKINYLSLRPIDGLKRIWKFFALYYLHFDTIHVKDNIEYKGFVKSVIDFFKKKKFNYQSDNYTDEEIPSVDDYYEYLEKKKTFLKIFWKKIGLGNSNQQIQENITLSKRLDTTFAKQIQNIDESYFNNDPDKILFHFIDSLKVGTPLTLIYDLQILLRMFRKFPKKTNSVCDENEKSMRNIILYSGDSHTTNINRFLRDLPNFVIVNDKLINTKKTQVKPIYTLGDIYYTYKPGKVVVKAFLFDPNKIDFFSNNSKLRTKHPSEKILNPKTGRFVLKNGKIGKKLVKESSQYDNFTMKELRQYAKKNNIFQTDPKNKNKKRIVTAKDKETLKLKILENKK